MPIPPEVLLIQGIPELLGVVLFTLAILGLPWQARQVSLLTLVPLTAIYLIRLLPLPFGVHTVIGLILLSAMITWLSRQQPRPVLIAATLSVITFLVLENTTLIIIHMAGTSITELAERPVLWALTGLPHAFCMIGVALLIHLRGRPAFLSKLGFQNGNN
ncbi:MAG: hypothetical protein H0Z39_02670 [Peptococcaceae bacterium]|nr:hypothetical protein [Peptococcaceae bacterium]